MMTRLHCNFPDSGTGRASGGNCGLRTLWYHQPRHARKSPHRHAEAQDPKRWQSYLYLSIFLFTTSQIFCTSQSMCHRLILMADNYTENKCHILLCFLCHLVHCKWFESIELLFGPVGHTHNGNDSVHHCHNNIAGDFSMVTLPEFLKTFPLAWTSESARPESE